MHLCIYAIIMLNVNPSEVHRLERQFQTTDSASRRFSQDRPTATTRADDRYLTLCAPRNRTATPTLLRYCLAAAIGRLESASTVYKVLRRPAICVPLTSRHRRDRLQWARQHVHWTPHQWKAVFFMDTSRFSLKNFRLI